MILTSSDPAKDMRDWRSKSKLSLKEPLALWCAGKEAAVLVRDAARVNLVSHGGEMRGRWVRITGAALPALEAAERAIRLEAAALGARLYTSVERLEMALAKEERRWK